MYYKIKLVLGKITSILSIMISTAIIIYFSLLMFYAWSDSFYRYENNVELFIAFTFIHCSTLWLLILCLTILLLSVYLFQKFSKKEAMEGNKILDFLNLILLLLLAVPLASYLQNQLIVFIFVLLILTIILSILKVFLKVPKDQIPVKSNSVIDKRLPQVTHWKEQGIINQDQYNAVVEKMINAYLEE